MTNLESLAEDIFRMKHRGKIMAALPLILSPRPAPQSTEKGGRQE